MRFPFGRDNECGQYHGSTEPGQVCKRCGVPWMNHPLWPDTVTITISREDAEGWADGENWWDMAYSNRMIAVCRAALEGSC